ncbi:hypothetical protein [Nonomuraea sp. NPDC048901]|uniref:hypothetical protein n=1 Tax=Nonomuraea sp. NPDC048901 TaxID=3155627 RepID=UPI0034046BC3
MNDQDALNGLSDGTFRAFWLREVLRTAQITESVKILLISMGLEEMDPSGRVSVPRVDLAGRIGRAPARVSERITEAVEMGFLIRLSAGKKRHTAVYAAAVKGSACSDLIEGSPEAGKGPAMRTESEHFGSDLQDAIAEPKGPPSRTETMFGSDLQDALETDEVRTGGPNDKEKGPHKRYAKVVGGVGEEVPPRPDGEDFLKVDEASAEAAPKRKRKAAKPKDPKPAVPKTSLPADFTVTDEMRAWALEEVPFVDIDLETQLFIIHFLDRPEIKRPGWERSWHAWMLRQKGWARDRPSNVRQLRPPGSVTALTRSTTDERVAQAQALKAKFASQQAQHPPTIQGEITR